MPYFDTHDHVRLQYTDWGEGRPIILCHAWALSSDAWQYQVPDLVAAGRRCITYDRRGHGRSDRPGGGYDIDTLADDLAALVDHVGIEDADLVGHSLGCSEIVRFTTRHGFGRVGRVVFLAPIMPNLLAASRPEFPVTRSTAMQELNE